MQLQAFVVHSVLRHLVLPERSAHLELWAHLECWNRWRHQALEFRGPKAWPGPTEPREQTAHLVFRAHLALLKSYPLELLELLAPMVHWVRRQVDPELEAQHLLHPGQPALLVPKAHSGHPEQLERPVK